MPKLDISKVAEIVKKNLPEDPAIVRRIIEEMNIASQPDEGDEKPPAIKKQFSFLVSDPENRLDGVDLVGWVLQLPETESPATVPDRIFRAAYDFNASKKGRLLPVSTVGEALENVPAKHFKDADLWVKTKVPVLLLHTDNKIPTEEVPK